MCENTLRLRVTAVPTIYVAIFLSICICPAQAQVEILFELKSLIGKYSVYCKVKSLVELVTYDTE